MNSLILAIVTLALGATGHGQFPAAEPPPWDPIATFSILGFDAETGEVGGAVQSRVFSVGNGVLWAEADAGVVATQAIVDVSYGPQALALLRAGLTPAAIVKTIWDSDPDPRPEDWTKQGRQFAVMNSKGNTPRSPDRRPARGRGQERQVLHGAGEYPRGRGGRDEMVRPSKRRQDTCRFA